MSHLVEKVTAFIMRETTRGIELVLFEHPYAGIQVPAGTVEAGEAPEHAALREAHEESGLTALTMRAPLGSVEQKLPEDERILRVATRVYARPDAASFDWASIRNGIVVKLLRAQNTFAYITYREHDDSFQPQYVTLQITGWVPHTALADSTRRHFFVIAARDETQARWTVHTDNHQFTCFWSPLDALPDVHPGQKVWLEIFLNWYRNPIESKPNRV